ncbi:MAG: hypothetical protein ACOH2M_10430 [Cypionkella sp.]
MWQLWRQRPVLVSAFLVASALTLFFAGRLAVQTVYWSNPAHQNQQVQGWMTVGYIGRSWHLAGPDLDAAAGLPGPKAKGHPQPLSEIARDRGVPVAQVIAEVEAAIVTLKAAEAAK